MTKNIRSVFRKALCSSQEHANVGGEVKRQKGKRRRSGEEYRCPLVLHLSNFWCLISNTPWNFKVHCSEFRIFWTLFVLSRWIFFLFHTVIILIIWNLNGRDFYPLSEIPDWMIKVDMCFSGVFLVILAICLCYVWTCQEKAAINTMKTQQQVTALS